MGKLSLNFLKVNGVCDEAYAWTQKTFEKEFLNDERLDWDYGRSKLIIYCEENPEITFGWVKWFDELKNSEAYIRFNGKEIKMGTYQVFNPLDGTHTDCETETEAKLLITEFAKKIWENHKIHVCQSISNEFGDSTWISVEIENPFTVTANV